MKTDNDIKNDVYAILKGSSLGTEVTGSIRKYDRAPGSTKEDVIISVLANESPRQTQEAFVNVNIYVKDLKLKAGNDYYHAENTLRTEQLSRVVANLFESAVIGESYRITLDRQRVIAVEPTHEHCISSKLLYQCINEK